MSFWETGPRLQQGQSNNGREARYCKHGDCDEQEASDPGSLAGVPRPEQRSIEHVLLQPLVVVSLPLCFDLSFSRSMTRRLAQERRRFGRITLSHSVSMSYAMP